MLWFGLTQKGYQSQNNLSFTVDGLNFGNNSIAYTDAFLSQDLMSQLNRQGFSIDFQLTPSSADGDPVKYILEITSEAPETQLVIWQWQSQIIAMNGTDFDYTLKQPRVEARLKPGMNKIRLVSGDQTYFESNGQKISRTIHPSLKLPSYHSKTASTEILPNSRMILGNSAQRQNSWQGTIKELSFFALGSGSGKDFLVAHYIFTPTSGEWVHDLSGASNVLHIPDEPDLLKQVRFDNRWGLFSFNMGAFIDISLNCLGFLPFGFLVASLMANSKINPLTGKLITIMLGFTLSFTIEFYQASIPSRFSSIEDLFFNSTGTVLGLVIFTYIQNRSKH